MFAPSTPGRDKSEYGDGSNITDPIKYSPPSPGYIAHVPVVASSHISYGSIANMNPFEDERYTRLGDMYDRSYPMTSEMHLPRRQIGMSHSQSESSIDIRKLSQPQNHYNTRPWQQHKPSSSGVVDNHIRFSEDTNTSSGSAGSSRGRGILRTPSPSKDLRTIREDASPEERRPTPATKRSRSPVKQLFGENGWLGKNTGMDGITTEETRKTGGFKHWGDKIKQRVDHLTDDIPKLDVTRLMPGSSPSKIRKHQRPTRFFVSLSPPQQAKLYSELELMIIATTNSYFMHQQREGRMSIPALSKIMDGWKAKNRPQVIEYFFDQYTQRELMLLNLETFEFYGPNGNNVVSINSMLHSWKIMAREMAIRNFCTPDVIVRKHFYDTHNLLQLLGAPRVTMHAFYKLREDTEWAIEEGQKDRIRRENTAWGTERQWIPSTTDEQMEALNPFL